MKPIVLTYKEVIENNYLLHFKIKWNIVAVDIYRDSEMIDTFFYPLSKVPKRLKLEDMEKGSLCGGARLPETVIKFFCTCRDRYNYFDEVAFEKIKQCFADGVGFFKELEEAIVIDRTATELIDQSCFKRRNVIYFNDDDHTFWPINKDHPVSMPIAFTLCEICGNDYDLSATIDVLEKHPYVFGSPTIEDVPYHQGKGEEAWIRFYVMLPQKIWEKVYTADPTLNFEILNQDILKIEKYRFKE